MTQKRLPFFSIFCDSIYCTFFKKIITTKMYTFSAFTVCFKIAPNSYPMRTGHELERSMVIFFFFFGNLIVCFCVLLKTYAIYSYKRHDSISYKMFGKSAFCELASVSPIQISSQRANDARMTSYQRRCDVMTTSHRRRSDVITTSCACWASFSSSFFFLLLLLVPTDTEIVRFEEDSYSQIKQHQSAVVDP